MPPSGDDLSIGDDRFVLRVLLDRWVTVKGGRERPTSDSLLDSNFENSCFVEGDISVEELRGLFPGLKTARIPISLIREAGFVLERRPDEAPTGCSNPQSHVVVGPTTELPRGEYEKKARQVVKAISVQILPAQ